MKRFMIIVLGLLVTAIGLLLANDFAVKGLMFCSGVSEAYKMYRLYRMDPVGETAIIGSSRAIGCYASSMLGENVYNYGMDGSRQNETVENLEVLLKRKHLKAVVVNLDPWGMETGPKCGDYSLVDGSLPGFRFFGLLKKSLAQYLNARMAGTKILDRGATLQRLERTSDEWRQIVDRIIPARFSVEAKVWEKYEKLLRGPHVPIVFVIAPASLEWWARYQGAEELEALKTRLSRYPQVKVVDLGDREGKFYDRTNWIDAIHLNQKGAMAFSSTLRNFLIQ